MRTDQFTVSDGGLLYPARMLTSSSPHFSQRAAAAPYLPVDISNRRNRIIDTQVLRASLKGRRYCADGNKVELAK